jgi:hypothetical protein
MGTLLDEIGKDNTHGGTTCAAATIRTGMSKADVDDYAAAMANPAFTSEAIARALRGRGHQIRGPQLQRHRRGNCSCEQP